MSDTQLAVLILLIFFILYLWIKFLVTKKRYNTVKRSVREKEEKRKATSKRRYVTPKLKAYILERDCYTCQICGISRGLLDSFIPHLGDYLLLEVDHIVPVAQGGRGDDEDNLQTLCWRCNRKKGSTKTNEEVLEEIDYGVNERYTSS